MHLFQSQLISTVKATEADDHRITFVGHYRHGDGASLPLISTIPSILMFVLFFTIAPHSLVAVLALGLLAPAFVILVYQKKLVFDLDSRQLHIRTQSLMGETKQELPFDDLQLRVEKIHIRLATNCGALDLLLSDGIIRLIVDGKFEWTVEKAERLSAQTGIALQPIGIENSPPESA